MFENIQKTLAGALKNLKGQGRITEINISETLKKVRNAFLEADVNYKVAKEFIDKVKEKAIGQKVISSLNPSQVIVKIIHDELAVLMGGKQIEMNLTKNPSIILVAGLQGSGKTTFCAKLASYLKQKKQKNPLLIAADVYRPAATEQLKFLGAQIEVPVFSIEDSKKPLEIVKKGIEQAKTSLHNVILIDTAGRIAIDEPMMKEIKEIYTLSRPTETLFVVDSMTGQDAINTAKAFDETINFDGVVLTKLDGDTKGGAALTISYVTEKPIKFVSSGEKIDTLDLFYPDRMAGRILGMGDVVSLVEKAKEQFDGEKARELQKKIAKNRFDLEDFLHQIGQLKKMGDMKSLLSMVPGMGKNLSQLNIGEDTFKDTEAIIGSMTLYEKRNPNAINTSRKERIAKGSGTSIEKVNNLLKQFAGLTKMIKQTQSTSGRQMLENMFSKMGLKNQNE